MWSALDECDGYDAVKSEQSEEAFEDKLSCVCESVCGFHGRGLEA